METILSAIPLNALQPNENYLSNYLREPWYFASKSEATLEITFVGEVICDDNNFMFIPETGISSLLKISQFMLIKLLVKYVIIYRYEADYMNLDTQRIALKNSETQLYIQ